MEKLLGHFGSLKQIALATEEELARIVPAKLAVKIKEFTVNQGTGS
jgi:excinuclease UvrABC nuclease subunit